MNSEKRISKKIHGYLVELDVYTEGGELRSDCFVSSRDDRYNSSLAFLHHEGGLMNHSTDEFKPVASSVIDKIMEWALEEGY